MYIAAIVPIDDCRVDMRTARGTADLLPARERKRR
jgi:hypothetical protein